MIATLAVLEPLFAVVFLFASVLAMPTFRVKSLLRLYACSSIALALLIFSFAVRDASGHLYPLALGTLFVKGLVIPALLTNAIRRSGASERLQSSLRAAPSLFVTVAALLVTALLIQHLPFAASAASAHVLYLSIAVAFAGILMMVLRRDVFSQMVGFLFIENGIAAFSLATIVVIPVAIEVGIFSIVLLAVSMMALLSHKVQELYGTSDTASLRELTD
ncbi:hypothetical protein HY734_01040 [Candidatus Uhrbacteria bacterium]|nr:hypothetical protein [Candidatus Uhrbacteria bacterium]